MQRDLITSGSFGPPVHGSAVRNIRYLSAHKDYQKTTKSRKNFALLAPTMSYRFVSKSPNDSPEFRLPDARIDFKQQRQERKSVLKRADRVARFLGPTSAKAGGLVDARLRKRVGCLAVSRFLGDMNRAPCISTHLSWLLNNQNRGQLGNNAVDLLYVTRSPNSYFLFWPGVAIHLCYTSS